MTIETKYNIGDEVWFIWENRAQRALIKGIKHITADPEISVTYELDKMWYDAPLLFREFALFPTKEELLKSL